MIVVIEIFIYSFFILFNNVASIAWQIFFQKDLFFTLEFIFASIFFRYLFNGGSTRANRRVWLLNLEVYYRKFYFWKMILHLLFIITSRSTVTANGNASSSPAASSASDPVAHLLCDSDDEDIDNDDNEQPDNLMESVQCLFCRYGSVKSIAVVY